MDRKFCRGDEIFEVAGRREGPRLVLSTPGGERVFAWEELGPGEYLLRENGRQHRCVVGRAGDDWWLWIEGHIHHVQIVTDARKRTAAPLGELTSPMPGQVLKVLVAAGQKVTKDQPLLVLEAMKMQYEIVAPRDGIVARVHAAAGTQVEGGVGLVTLEPVPGETGAEPAP
jgi:acetyl/propionyl-CoA carboxylase alpha subunit